MRQISIYRPKEKVRGAKRRLKALNVWANSFKEFIPEEWCCERYIDFSIPVLDRLLDPPTTTSEWQNQAIEAFYKALNNLEKSKPETHKGVPINLIISWPNLSDSRIIIFFNRDYYDEFYQSDGEWQKRIPEEIKVSKIPFHIPQNISVEKIKYMNRDFDGKETTAWYIQDWYVFSLKN